MESTVSQYLSAIRLIFQVHECVIVLSYVIEHGCPSFHGDALEDSEHGKQDVVELSDAVVRADPGIAAVVAGRTLTHATRELQL